MSTKYMTLLKLPAEVTILCNLKTRGKKGRALVARVHPTFGPRISFFGQSKFW